jgi:type IV pilus assembly protein PilM
VDETSIWKKEIKLRRKPKASGRQAPQAPQDETSIWKKEIKLRRKPKASGGQAPQAPQAEPSIWKKEITLRRKPEAKQGGTVPPSEQPAERAASFRPVTPPPVPPTSPRVAAPPVDPQVPPVSPEVPSAGPPVSTPPPPVPLVSVPLPPVSPRVSTFSFDVPDNEPEDAPLPASPPVPERPLSPSSLSPAEGAPAGSVPELESDWTDASPPAAPELQLDEPTVVLPAPDPERRHESVPIEAPAATRRERRDARRAAARRAKDDRKRTKRLAKTEGRKVPRKHKRVVGLKVGGSQIAAVEVVNNGRPRVVRMARMPLDRGVIVGGELREPEELARALKTFFGQNNLKRTNVRLGVSNNRIGVRTFEITGIDDDRQLANAVRFRAQETLPIPLDEAVLDYRILDERVDADGVRVRRVLLVVAHRELVERYVAACRKAGLKLIGIDLEAFALLRALSDPARPPAEDAATVCISIGHDRSTLAVSDGRVCEFTRVLAWGGSALDVALARVLDVTPSRAETIKHELSLVDEGTAAGLDADRADEGRHAMATELQTFAREIVASLRFYQEQPESLGIAEILVTGGTSAYSGLAAELERLIGLPVRVADPLARVQLPRKLRKAKSAPTGSLAVAVGLGIED